MNGLAAYSLIKLAEWAPANAKLLPPGQSSDTEEMSQEEYKKYLASLSNPPIATETGPRRVPSAETSRSRADRRLTPAQLEQRDQSQQSAMHSQMNQDYGTAGNLFDQTDTSGRVQGTAKGGHKSGNPQSPYSPGSVIPPRPAAHPMSKGYAPGATKPPNHANIENASSRIQQGSPVLPSAKPLNPQFSFGGQFQEIGEKFDEG